MDAIAEAIREYEAAARRADSDASTDAMAKEIVKLITRNPADLAAARELAKAIADKKTDAAEAPASPYEIELP